MRLAQQLPPLSEAQQKWARRAIFTHIAFAAKQKGWCSDCGAIFAPIDNDKRCVCPKCGAKLKVERSRRLKLEENVYFTQLSVISGYQVVRHYEARRYSRRGQATHHAYCEVVQEWIDERGHRTYVARNTPSCWGFGGGWSWLSEMEIRKPTSYSYAVCKYNIWANICPGAEVLPKLRKHGYTVRCQTIAPSTIMARLLTDNNAETLIKQRQYSMLAQYIRRGGYSRLRHAINIATRNGYRIKDASMWCDYIELLDYFNIDTHNAKYVCPANLRYEHDKLMHRKRIIEERERVAQERRRNLAQLESCAKAKAQYKKHKGRFLGVVLTQGALHASVLPDVEAFMQEGEAMRHCVFTNEYYKRKDCLIFSVRDNKDNRVATVEFNLKTFEVVQCRGKANSQPKEYGEILKMFQLGAEQIRKIQQYKAS